MTLEKVRDIFDSIFIGICGAFLLAVTCLAYKVGGFQAVLGVLAVLAPAFTLGRMQGQKDILKALKKGDK